jgi:hypothetical protein
MPCVDIHYQYFPPDDVVSARHFGDLAEGLAERGWKVRVYPSNRSCRANGASYPLRETINGVEYHRIWRPDFPQNRAYGRILNALWMLVAWSGRAIWEKDPPDVMITGTDPIFSALVSIPWKWTYPRTKQVHWCFDLYPDALVAEGLIKENSMVHRFFRALMASAMRSQDLIANLGSCMESRLNKYAPEVPQITITPWALVEPAEPPQPDPEIRRQLFGDAEICLLYSGSFGRAHAYEPILALARSLRNESVAFCFAVRGNRVDQLKAAVRPDDTNIKFAGYASEAELEKRLASADIHIASLQPEWTGCVVPSKFFGSLAIGRPVLLVGNEDAAPNRWIKDLEVGWQLTSKETELTKYLLIRSKTDTKSRSTHSHKIYSSLFSKKGNLDRLTTELNDLPQTALSA